MTHTFEKIGIGIIFVILIGLNSFFILGQETIPREEVSQETATIEPNEITRQQAKTIALRTVKGFVTELEEKIISGVPAFSVEIQEGTIETEIFISKKDGDILKISQESIEDEQEEEIKPEELQQLQTASGILTETEAKALALQVIPGTVTGFEAEREDGRLVYEVEIAAQGDRVEVEIDAETREILEIEWGDDD